MLNLQMIKEFLLSILLGAAVTSSFALVMALIIPTQWFGR